VTFPSRIKLSTTLLLCLTLPCISEAEESALSSNPSGVRVVSYYGYDDCIELRNEQTRVVLCPAAGGRVLEYSLGGKNVLYLPPGSEGWRQTPDQPRGKMHAGRFDIGPEKMVRRGRVLWQGPWKSEITGDRSARLTSQYDPESGVRLIRDFKLAANQSQLVCTQTIRNESTRPVSLCHWSRTFAIGGGIAIVPRSPRGRFPNGFVLYQEGHSISIAAEDPHIKTTEQAVIISGPPKTPKLGFDSHAGWMAYLAPTDQLFVKRYRTFPERAYNEFASLTASVWYPEGDRVELEPIGPAENLRPGDQANFSEEWWLLTHDFPADAKTVDYAAIKRKVERFSQPPDDGNRRVTSPVVNQDQSVTFRVTGQAASQVRVRVANRARRMELNHQGVWEYRTEPLAPGLHEYTFEIDGVRVTDPSNRVIKKWLNCASMVEVTGTPAPLTQQQPVPHGTLHHHLYSSTTTENDRQVVVYTPPGYDLNNPEAYPLVVLCHGFGDDQAAWTEVGRAHLIMDNLISQKKIEPMVIAMPFGHPVPLSERERSENYALQNSRSMTADIVNDLLPMLNRHYHVTKQSSQRAVVGLSMGGGQAIHAGMSHPETFGWIGAFSAATPEGNLRETYPEIDTAIKAHPGHRKLFWIACGVDDFLLQRNRQFDAELDRLNITHHYIETEGGHSWPVWRGYLPKFLEQLFR